ncbi:hypothetical protein [Flaviaesturariibacter amylovorans]|uniref:Lipoprotein n=1 Tax=Flaviaesturariibacter amylovorans TaxID=1084520 RepID=A0ABP8HTC4_9BACT
MAGWRGIGFGFMAVCLLSCSSNDGGGEVVRRPEKGFYLEGTVRSEEGSPLVTVLLQGREDGPEGDFYEGILDLKLDGQPLAADSSRLGGIFYEAQVPVEDFAGSHRLEGTAPGGATFKKEFTYAPLRFAAEPPARLSRTGFRLQLQGVPEGGAVVLVLTDTAFVSNDLAERVTVSKGLLTLSPDQLRDVRNGPAQLQLTCLQELDLGEAVPGKVRIEHTLRRELELRD